MTFIDRVTSSLVENRRVIVPILLLVILIVGAGVTNLEEDNSLQSFEVGTEEEQKLDYIESNFSAGSANETVTQVVIKDDNVLDKKSLLTALEVQQEIRSNESIAPTLRDEQPTVGVANIVARTVIRHRQPSVTDPSIDRQMEVLESMDQREINAVVTRLLAETEGPQSDALALMPTDYDSGSTNASATMIAVFQTTETVSATGNAPEAIVTSQLAVQDVAAASDGSEEILVVGNGIITDEQQQSRADTLTLLGPLALLFVLVTLVVVYRDIVDIGLSLAGIMLVQVWTFGTLGWVGISFNPVLIAIPVLLIGLSIDYGIHVFMRYREQRAVSDEGISSAMRTALSGVGVALLWVTVTTVVGFLSNLASPVRPIQELGVISAIGIVGALVVFGLFLPLVKVMLDRFFERVGIGRVQRPIGTGTGRAARVLSVGSRAAKKAPVFVIIVTLLITALTTVGATQVSTSFEPEDNIAEDAPAWTETLPEQLQPGEYTVRENLRYVNEHFVRHDSQGEILVEGNVTHPEMVERFEKARDEAAAQDVTVVLANGEARTKSPLSVMERVAAQNETFNETFSDADTDGDGIPETPIESLYDDLYETASEEAASVLHRQDGEYVAARMAVSVNAEADGEATTGQLQAVAGTLDGNDRRVTATGEPVVNQLIQDYLLETLLTSLAITIGAILALLMVVYRLVHGSATLGLITLLPVVFVVSWIIGTMHVLGYPLSVLTTIVASITIGIGIDYSIHVSERFKEELDDGKTVEEAVTRTIRGTGSALLGSAVTTAIGFGVLGLAFFPVLQQFGTITAIMVIYAFLASVLVLPSLLVCWARYVSPERWSSTERTQLSEAGEPVDD